MAPNITSRPTIAITACKSQVLAGYGYDAATKTLAVQFPPRGNATIGAIYHYEAVEPDVADAFEKAESKGSFFIARIKRGGYSYVRIDDDSSDSQPAEAA